MIDFEIKPISEQKSVALEWCMESHYGSLDKNCKPFVLHPIRVAMSLMSEESDDVFIAALLHDTVENTTRTIEEIREKFGEKVASLVDSLTRRNGETYMQFIHRCAADPIARIIKLADIEDNIRPERVQTLPDAQRGITDRYDKARKILNSHNQ